MAARHDASVTAAAGARYCQSALRMRKRASLRQLLDTCCRLEASRFIVLLRLARRYELI